MTHVESLWDMTSRTYPAIDSRVVLRNDATAEMWTPPTDQALEQYLERYPPENIERMQTPVPLADQVGKMRDLDLIGVVHGTDVEALSNAVDRYPDRLIGFAKVDPDDGMDAVRAFELAVEEYGMAGLDTSPWLTGIRPTDRRYYPLYAKAEELGVPVNVHASNSMNRYVTMDYGHPKHVDQIAAQFPELRIIARHAGWPYIDQMIGVTFRQPNVYVELSGFHPRHWDQRLVDQIDGGLLTDRALWGTSHPIIDWEDSLEGLDRLGINEETKRNILYDNPARLYGL